MSFKVLVHVVTWNSAQFINPCLSAVLAQEGVSLGKDFDVLVTDNASTDDTADRVRRMAQFGITLHRNSENLGFSGAHNQGVSKGVAGAYSHILILNPDVALSTTCLEALLKGFERDPAIGFVTPKLLRADSDLTPIVPATIDAAGMIITDSLRHFDRGSGEVDCDVFNIERFVFGGTGACLLVSLECAWSVALPATTVGDGVFEIYPQLGIDADQRVQLFDEAFFAYREDADLAWRGRRLGWRCLYKPNAIAHHVRVVTPERRDQLPVEYNLYGVRNRFLLQLNNWSFSCGFKTFINGMVIRNALVVAGVIVNERSSITGLVHVIRLLYRADKIRGELAKRRREVRMRIPATSLNALNEEDSATP